MINCRKVDNRAHVQSASLQMHLTFCTRLSDEKYSKAGSFVKNEKRFQRKVQTLPTFLLPHTRG